MTVYFDKERHHWRYHFERSKKRYCGYCLDAEGNPVKSRSAAREAEAVAKRRIDIEPKMVRGDGVSLAMIVSAILPRLKMQAQWDDKRRYLREIVAYFGAEIPIAKIGQTDVDDYITYALSQPLKVWTGGPNRDPSGPENERYWKDTGKKRSASTVNRYLPILREIFERAYNTRDPITSARVIAEVLKIVDLPEPKRRARPIPDAVLSKVLEKLPPHVVDAMLASLYFGFRRSEIFHMEISDVDFERGGVWLAAEYVKDHEDAFLPGAPQAMAHMRKLVDQAKEREQTRLITWRPMESPKTAWATAMNDIEREFGRRWRWHDIRAAYITQVAITAGPIAAQALARHSDFRTTQGYISVADETLRAGAKMAAERPALAIHKGGKS
jgi:integrase